MPPVSNERNRGLDAAVRAAGGSAALARKLGLTPSAVGNWRSTGIPASRAPEVSRVTGVPLHVLRPDVFSERSYAGFAEEQAPFGIAAEAQVAEARALGLDADAIVAKALEEAIFAEKKRRWVEENREAIEAWNRYFEENDTPLAQYRMF